MAQQLHQDPCDRLRAKGLFRWSILYLFGICLLLLLARTTAADQFNLQLPSLFNMFSGAPF
jgi:protoheme IX farnesyltransferase